MIYYDKNSIVIRDFETSDISEIVAGVRDIDREDIQTLFNMTPEESINHSYPVSTHKFTIILHDHIVALLGLMPETLLGDRALVWMVTTKEIENNRISFLRGSKFFIKYLFTLYRSFYGTVRNKNFHSLNWLKWIGARVISNDENGFHYFILEEI